MGTRADFYIGTGENSEWIGLIAMDGYPDGIEKSILCAPTEENFRNLVSALKDTRDDFTVPEMGWPWPWKDGSGTDYSYTYDNGKVMASSFGGPWFDPNEEEPETEIGDRPTFPDMRDRQMVTFGTRSGLIVISG